MKLLISVILTAILSLLMQLFLPWWSLLIAAAIVGAAFSLSGFLSFLGGFLGTAIVWWGYAWMIDMKNQAMLSSRIAELFNAGSPAVLILFCGMTAGVVGGFAALSGSEVRKII